VLAVTERLGPPDYDESEIAGRVEALPSAARALFACACAERLMAAFRWFCDVTGSASFTVVREALDAAWSAGGAGRAASAGEVTALVLGDAEAGLSLGFAVAQNAVACVAYALEVRQTGAVQTAVWAARQLHEAADAVVQQGAAVQAYVEDIDQEPPVRLVVRGIYSALDAAGSASAADLLAGAREDGEAFLGFVTGSACE
jgi:hypothetical protein